MRLFIPVSTTYLYFCPSNTYILNISIFIPLKALNSSNSTLNVLLITGISRLVVISQRFRRNRALHSSMGRGSNTAKPDNPVIFLITQYWAAPHEQCKGHIYCLQAPFEFLWLDTLHIMVVRMWHSSQTHTKGKDSKNKKFNLFKK